MGKIRPNRKSRLAFQFLGVAVCISLVVLNLKASSKGCVELEPEVLASLRGGAVDKCEYYTESCPEVDGTCSGLWVCESDGCESDLGLSKRRDVEYDSGCEDKDDPEYSCEEKEDSWEADFSCWQKCQPRLLGQCYCKMEQWTHVKDYWYFKARGVGDDCP